MSVVSNDDGRKRTVEGERGKEQRVKSKEQRAKSKEQRAKAEAGHGRTGSKGDRETDTDRHG